MDFFKAMALYLVYKRITSSQSMSKWFGKLVAKFGEDIRDEIAAGRFQEYVRLCHEDKVFSGEIATYLLQVTLWIDEALESLQSIKEVGIQVLMEGDFGFPPSLAEIADKPTILFAYGNTDLARSGRLITLVGTREPSKWGQIKAKQFAVEAAACKITTVSGLASGVDSIVYTEAQQFRAPTIAVVPQLPDLRELSASSNTLYLSEYPPSDQGISKWQFVARNRLLAGLSEATIVVEAPLRSGTLITADLALSYGKPVYVTLPDPNESSSYGGIVFSQSQLAGAVVNSLYDIFYQEGWETELELYKVLVEHISQGKIAIKARDHRHLAQADLKRYLYESSKGDLSILESSVLELQRFGIIRERKNKIVFNFSGSNSWPKI
jgi:DNA protecting protein DprA